MIVVELFLGDRHHVNRTDRDVFPTDSRPCVFTQTKWEAFFPPPWDDND